MKDPLAPIMQACLGLARADTHSGALEWFNVPITDLVQWVEAINLLENRNKNRKK